MNEVSNKWKIIWLRVTKIIFSQIQKCFSFAFSQGSFALFSIINAHARWVWLMKWKFQPKLSFGKSCFHWWKNSLKHFKWRNKISFSPDSNISLYLKLELLYRIFGEISPECFPDSFYVSISGFLYGKWKITLIMTLCCPPRSLCWRH